MQARGVRKSARRVVTALLIASAACTRSGQETQKMKQPIAPLVLPGAEPFSAELSERMRAALAAKGEKYEPRTHHKKADGSPEFINRLIFETSPYLLQHAHNPVSWYAWGPDAFEAARALNRPIFLSIGYSTCHWCHVMERESFEDEEIAAYLNANYIAIKVDREERPDVDSVYMTAVQLLTGGGGWPMSVVMLPDGRPFFGGTYFPARDGDRGARIGFLTILKRLEEAFDQDRENVVQASTRLTETMRLASQRADVEDVPGPEALHAAARALSERWDPVWGGFGRAPKFPRPSTYELLLRHHRRAKDPGSLKMVTHSLDKMIRGGMYDQVGGGFHRYSTDGQWLVPHFEKMLYDNAQLAVLLVETWQVTKDERFQETARETLDYVLREMTSPEGAFYSATDADSEGEEGLFFVWKKEELERILGPELGKLAIDYWGVSERGNFEGRNILFRPKEQKDPRIEEAKRKLYEHRKTRIPPLLDDKVLTEWNAQMISAFARAGFAFGEPRYVAAAARAADFLLAELATKENRLIRAWRQGQAKHDGVLEDHAYLVAALLDLYEANGETRYLERAIALHGTMEKLFLDEKAGGFFGTASDGEQLLIREKPFYDGAQPSGNSYAALNLLRLAEFTTEDRYRKTAGQTLRAFGNGLAQGALECPKLALALDFFHDRPKEVVIVGSETDRGDALIDVVRSLFLPNRILVVTREADVERLEATIPLVEGKRAINGKATAYVCLAQSCKKPTSSPDELAAQLRETEPLPSARPLDVR
jgi:uncharacterized protein YyaL (SSP411 family)